ncbi:MAG TPA: hypothetical protein PK417_04990 [Hyphomonas sp.]|nr:hypothetical protein [Hyphomonas sp.]HRX73040.1 hypothetical protein [Hyphomonas sp.]
MDPLLEALFDVIDLRGVFEKVGPWLSTLIIATAIVLFLSLRVAVSRLLSPAPQGPKAETTQRVSNVKDSTVTVTAAPTVQQKDVSGATKVAGRDQVNIQKQVNVYPTIVRRNVGEEGMPIIQQPVDVTDAEGVKHQTDVYVMWQDASWGDGTLQFNEDKLDRFFAGSLYQSALKRADAIVCVGLVSSWLPKGEMSPEREQRLRGLSDRRAKKLCARIAEETQSLDRQPVLIGMGLGFNRVRAPDKAADSKQRALVLIHVNSKVGHRPATKEQTRGIVRQVLTEASMPDFDPRQYSQSQPGRAVCWFSMEQGEFELDPDCES